jgi:hypothetical protein
MFPALSPDKSNLDLALQSPYEPHRHPMAIAVRCLGLPFARFRPGFNPQFRRLSSRFPISESPTNRVSKIEQTFSRA